MQELITSSIPALRQPSQQKSTTLNPSPAIKKYPASINEIIYNKNRFMLKIAQR